MCFFIIFLCVCLCTRRVIEIMLRFSNSVAKYQIPKFLHIIIKIKTVDPCNFHQIFILCNLYFKSFLIFKPGNILSKLLKKSSWETICVRPYRHILIYYTYTSRHNYISHRFIYIYFLSKYSISSVPNYEPAAAWATSRSGLWLYVL